ncbi:phage portal protein [Bradyrhizobium sp. 4]|uniref:phage portal protein n=1 Tax=unclassified Bradyrhizobium TaxID=2631580 RepID=UPI001FF7228D|nr:phage portal protein [Bradyrhizobium sp. 4]
MGLFSFMGGKAKAFSDGLEAGRMARRMANWVPSRVHVNTLISASGATALSRARYLVRNNGYASNAVEVFTSNLIGAGIVPSWNPPPETNNGPKSGVEVIGANGGPNLEDEPQPDDTESPLKAKLQQLWTDWTDEADAEGLTDFYGLERRVGRELFIAGEVFIRLRPRFLSDGLTVPLQLQVLPSEMLPIWKTEPAEGGNYIRQGIEFDRIGRRVAYHFYKEHPGDQTVQQNTGETVRVPAESILHVFDPVEAGQIRGLSKLTPAIVSLWMLDNFDDAELERKKTAALFSVFIHRPDPNGEFFEEALAASKDPNNKPAAINLAPGTVHELLPGEEIETASPADVGASYEPFQYRTLLRICAALGLPYAGMTGDRSRANYSSERSANIDLRRRCDALQHNVVAFQMCRAVWAMWLRQAVLAGAIELPGFADDPKPYNRVTWIPPSWQWIDPLKDLQAEVLAIDNGLKPRSLSVEEAGRDPDENDRRIAADQRREKRLGIVLRGTPTAAKQVSLPPPDDTPPTQQGTQQ